MWTPPFLFVSEVLAPDKNCEDRIHDHHRDSGDDRQSFDPILFCKGFEGFKVLFEIANDLFKEIVKHLFSSFQENSGHCSYTIDGQVVDYGFFSCQQSLWGMP